MIFNFVRRRVKKIGLCWCIPDVYAKAKSSWHIKTKFSVNIYIDGLLTSLLRFPVIPFVGSEIFSPFQPMISTNSTDSENGITIHSPIPALPALPVRFCRKYLPMAQPTYNRPVSFEMVMIFIIVRFWYIHFYRHIYPLWCMERWAW